MLINRLMAAEIITAPSHDWVYCEDLSIGNEGYIAFDELDNELSGRTDKPCFVFDCDVQKWKGIDIDDAIESELGDWYEGSGDHVAFYDELVAFINEWNSKQTLCQYFPRYNRIIVLDVVRFNELINGES